NIRASEIKRVFSYSPDKSESDEKLKKRIYALGYAYYLDHEYEIINYIENGWMDEAAFLEKVDILNQRQIKNNVSSKLTEVWDLYNSNFLSTSEQVISGLENFLKEYLKEISIRELYPILDILEQLKDNFNRSYWIDKLVEFNIDSDDNNLLRELKNITTNQELIDKISIKQKALNQHHSIYSVLSKVVKNNGFNLEDEEYLGSHSIDEIYDFLITDGSHDLMLLVRHGAAIFSFSEGERPRDIFGRNLHQALIRVAKRSRLDNYRIKHFFDIELDNEIV
ncbi:TPA: hypothetical protein RUZ24_002748, partial [Vibrio cholerae]|nr:hypothetical protein [Vibrio cholerae]